MNVSAVYFIVSIGIAFLIASLLYFFPKKKKNKPSWLLFGLRFVSVLALLALFINPKWEKESLSIEKPQMAIAFDNSHSIHFIKAQPLVKSIYSTLNTNTALQEKFDIKYYSFGSRTKVLDSLTFTENQTNPMDLFQQIDALGFQENIPVLIVTDGNQTRGTSYEYLQTKNIIYPVVVGDTTQHEDLQISKINVNQYSFLDNQFPVEIFTLYKGNQNAGAQLSIYEIKKHIYTKKIQFSKEKSTQNTTLMLPANSVGNHYYQAVISPLEKEKNIKNNRKDFSVEVVDEQSQILILSSFSHPDLGALKKSIESNKQRKVTLKIGAGNKIDFSKYQLVILFQPTATQATAIKSMDSKHIGRLIITGTKTDWTFLNTAQKKFSKKFTNLKENYLAAYNTSFSGFVTKDIDFDQLPPLEDKFGSIAFQVPFQSLLFQKIGNTTTESPLLAIFTEADQKNAVLFGEGFWRWRMFSKIADQSYQPYDEYWGRIFQYLANTEKTKQLQLMYKKLYFSNEKVVVNASFVDENYQTDTKASLDFFLTNTATKEVIKMPFYLDNDKYIVDIDNLESGKYTFYVKVLEQNVKSYGSFKILDYNVEQQFTTANTKALKKLASETGGKVIYTNALESGVLDLINDPQYKSIQKSKIISKPLIDWRWLLGFIILSLSVEWFIRKFRGLI